MLSDVKTRADTSEVKCDSPRVEQATKSLQEAREKHAQRIACLHFCEAIFFVVGFLFLIRVHEDTEQVYQLEHVAKTELLKEFGPHSLTVLDVRDAGEVWDWVEHGLLPTIIRHEDEV